MGKAVRVFIILGLLLSIAALVFGILLFQKRELLKGRTQTLEEAVIKLGTVIEEEDPIVDTPPKYPARDLSPNELEFIEEQDYSTFWDDYAHELEVIDIAPLNLNKRKEDLMRYYRRDATGTIVRDATGLRVTTGENTMRSVLDDLQERAEAQYNRLNDTRQMLTDTRTELVATIRELNESKAGFRQALDTIRKLEADIARLETEVQSLKDRVAELEEEKRALQEAVAEERRQVQLLQENEITLNGTIDKLKNELEALRKVASVTTRPDSTQQTQEVATDTGVKGSVVSVDPRWNFVIVSLDKQFLHDLIGDDLDQPLPPVELMVKRPVEGAKDMFVTKIRLRKVRRGKLLAVADVLTDWQQDDIKAGDIIFY